MRCSYGQGPYGPTALRPYGPTALPRSASYGVELRGQYRLTFMCPGVPLADQKFEEVKDLRRNKGHPSFKGHVLKGPLGVTCSAIGEGGPFLLLVRRSDLRPLRRRPRD